MWAYWPARASRTSSASRPMIAFRQARVLGLDHQSDRGLGPARPDQDPPAAAQFGLCPADGRGHLRAELRCVARHVDQHLRVLRHHLGRGRQRHAVPVHRGEQLQAGQHAVAGGGMLEHDDVPGLLAAEHVTTALHGRGHVLVAHRRLDHLDAGVAHRHVEALVRHHRDHHRVARQPTRFLQPGREHGQDLVAVERLPIRVDREAAVGVAVIGDARIRAVLDDRRGQRAECGGAAAVVDVQAVRLVADGDDLRARQAQRLRREAVSRAVRAVGHDPQARQRRLRVVRQRGQQVVQVSLVLGAGVADPAELAAVRHRLGYPQPGLDLVFGGVRQLDPAGTEELDPVVPGRVVARGDDHAEGGAQRSGQVGHARRGDDPQPEHVHPGAGQAGDDGRLEELARYTRVPADHGHRAPVTCARAAGRGLATAATLRSMARRAVSSRPATPRTPSVPNRRLR